MSDFPIPTTLPPLWHVTFANNLDAAIAFHRVNKDDPHNVGNAAVLILCEMRDMFRSAMHGVQHPACQKAKFDPNLPEIPQHVISAAIVLEQWFALQGVTDWELMGVRARFPKQKDLPQVAGSLEISNAEFEHRCRVYLGEEQEKPLPDNGLIALLCDGVRMAREYSAAMNKPV